jgi:hypothetical protein
LRGTQALHSPFAPSVVLWNPDPDSTSSSCLVLVSTIMSYSTVP